MSCRETQGEYILSYSNKANPVLVEVFRKDIVESTHRGSAVVVNFDGQTILSVGNVDRRIYPRSALKFFQALPLLESGAADRFRLQNKEIALACASHSGESIHTTTVIDWLESLGLGIDDLENGPDLPESAEVVKTLLRNNKLPSKAHHNCSGKHAGMLTMARHLKESASGYSRHDHVVQRAWMTSLSELVDLDISSLEWEQDGCGMPAVCMPLKSLAYACALYAKPDNLGSRRSNAVLRLRNAVAKNPIMAAGTGRCCTDIIQITGGRVLVKTGAEATFAAILPELSLGLALKIDDGAGRASEVALGALLKQTGAISDHEYKALLRYFEPKIYNSCNVLTGRIAPSQYWRNMPYDWKKGGC